MTIIFILKISLRSYTSIIITTFIIVNDNIHIELCLYIMNYLYLLKKYFYWEIQCLINNNYKLQNITDVKETDVKQKFVRIIKIHYELSS